MQASPSICVIPARGGSKRIPRKNCRDFHGKPMINWSIDAAFASQCFDEIIVSTDDADIADIAQAAGATVPMLRPKQLSGDNIATQPVIKHAIEELCQVGKNADDDRLSVCCLYATAPFVRAEDIIKCSELLDGWDFVVPVTSYAFPIQRAFKIAAESNSLAMFSPQHYGTRSQDLEEAYHDAGQFYWGTARAWLSGESPFQMKSRAHLIPRWRVQDIDTEEDWQHAMSMFEALKLR